MIMLMGYLTPEERAQHRQDKSVHDTGGAVWPQYDDRPGPDSERQQELKQEYEADTFFEWTDYEGVQHEGRRESYCYDEYGRPVMWRNGIVMATCSYCGQVYFLKTGAAKRIQKYCSERCRNDAYIDRRKSYQAAERQKICPVCGHTFKAKRKDTVYCSNACRQQRYRNSRDVIDNCSAHTGTTGNRNTECYK